jgi:hypothetical protein
VGQGSTNLMEDMRLFVSLVNWQRTLRFEHSVQLVDSDASHCSINPLSLPRLFRRGVLLEDRLNGAIADLHFALPTSIATGIFSPLSVGPLLLRLPYSTSHLRLNQARTLR